MNYKKLFLFGMFFISNIGLFGAEGGGEADGAPVRDLEVTEKAIKIFINDSEEFNVPLSIACRMAMIRNMLEDLGEDDDLPIRLPDVVSRPAFELLISLIGNFQHFYNATEEKFRVCEKLKELVREKCRGGDIQEELNLLISLGMAANFLDPHIFKDEADNFTMDIIVEVLIDLLMEHKERIFSGLMSMPECLNTYGVGSVFAERFMSFLERKSPWICQQLLEHSSDNRSLAVLGDGRFISGHGSGEAYIWKLGEDRRFFLNAILSCEEFDRPFVFVTSIARLPRGCVAVGYWNCSFRVWQEIGDGNWFSGPAVEVVNDEEGSLSLAALPDGRICTGSFDGLFRVWQERGDGGWYCSFSLPVSQGSYLSLVALPDGRIAAVDELGNLRVLQERENGIWDCSFFLEISAGSRLSLVALPDGRIAVSDELGNLRIYKEREANEWICDVIVEGDRGCLGSSLASLGSLVVSGGKFNIFKEKDGRLFEENLVQRYRPVQSVCILNDYLIASGEDRGILRIWINLLRKFKKNLTLQEGLVVLLILQERTFPKIGTQANNILMDISGEILSEIFLALEDKKASFELTLQEAVEILGADQGASETNDRQRRRSRREAFGDDNLDHRREKKRRVQMPSRDQKTGASAAPSEEEVARFLAKEKEAEDDSDQEDD